MWHCARFHTSDRLERKHRENRLLISHRIGMALAFVYGSIEISINMDDELSLPSVRGLSVHMSLQQIDSE